MPAFSATALLSTSAPRGDWFPSGLMPAFSATFLLCDGCAARKVVSKRAHARILRHRYIGFAVLEEKIRFQAGSCPHSPPPKAGFFGRRLRKSVSKRAHARILRHATETAPGGEELKGEGGPPRRKAVSASNNTGLFGPFLFFIFYILGGVLIPKRFNPCFKISAVFLIKTMREALIFSFFSFKTGTFS
jgi:hypothetical protein